MRCSSPTVFQYLDENFWKIPASHERTLGVLKSSESAVAGFPDASKESVLAGIVFLAHKHKPVLDLSKKTELCKYNSDCYRSDCRYAHSEAMTKAAKRVFDIVQRRASYIPDSPALCRTASGTLVDRITADLSKIAASCALQVLDPD